MQRVINKLPMRMQIGAIAVSFMLGTWTLVAVWANTLNARFAENLNQHTEKALKTLSQSVAQESGALRSALPQVGIWSQNPTPPTSAFVENFRARNELDGVWVLRKDGTKAFGEVEPGLARWVNRSVATVRSSGGKGHGANPYFISSHMGPIHVATQTMPNGSTCVVVKRWTQNSTKRFESSAQVSLKVSDVLKEKPNAKFALALPGASGEPVGYAILTSDRSAGAMGHQFAHETLWMVAFLSTLITCCVSLFLSLRFASPLAKLAHVLSGELSPESTIQASICPEFVLIAELMEEDRSKRNQLRIQNSLLEDHVEARMQELAQACDETIEGWSRAMDIRDHETEGHCRRVTEMTLLLAESFEFTEIEIQNIRRGAMLHDIGKIGVPDHILLKPGKLDPAERAVMEQHTVLAFQMLSPIAFLREALDIPTYHHEKWDGTGYPMGLTGQDIPVAARVFAVADVWDALRSDRPYRSAWPEDRVREYIREQSGIHFDPQVVEAYLALSARQLETIRNKHPQGQVIHLHRLEKAA